MSRRDVFVNLVVLTSIVCHVLAVVDFDDTDTSELEQVYRELEANATQGEVPVGRTFFLLHLLKQKLKQKLLLDQITTPYPFTGCICVPFYLCDANGTIVNDGTGVIDIRYVYRRCTGDLEVCCYLRAVIPTTPRPMTMMPPMTIPTTIPTTTRPPTTIPTTRPPTIPSTIPTTRPPTTPPVYTIPTTPPPIYTFPTTAPPIYTIPTTAPPIYTIPTTAPPIYTIPTTAAPIYTLPTTARPVYTVPTTAVPIVQTIIPLIYPSCTCIPVYQCAIYGSLNTGTVVPGTGIGALDGTGLINPRQQFANTCVGAYVCCTYAPGAASTGVAQVPIPVTQAPNFPAFTLPTAAATAVLPPIVYGQSCVCMLVTLCSLGYISMSGAGNIDPRLILGRQGQPVGTCNTPNSMCCRITQDTSPVPTSNPNSIAAIDIKNPGTANACRCVLMAQCPDGQAVTHDGIGAIDPRFGPCQSATLVCCRLQNRQRTDITIGITTVQNSAIVNPGTGTGGQQVNCGLRETTYAASTQQGPETAYFAEFPWMALILVRKPGVADTFQCGGSLINSRAIITAAHCVTSCDPGTLIVRLGEWNTQNTNEPLPFQEIPVQSFIIHPNFFSGGLYHDVAVVILTRPVTYAVNVRPVCLPTQGQFFAAGTICYASGWGRSAFGEGGMYQNILRKVDLPIIDNASCQARLRTTRLGPLFQLHWSFICAGGMANKDTCYKDGGGPLVCQDQTGKFTQAGIISWGIGCGSSTPAVYASVAQHRQWIDQHLALNGIYS